MDTSKRFWVVLYHDESKQTILFGASVDNLEEYLELNYVNDQVLIFDTIKRKEMTVQQFTYFCHDNHLLLKSRDPQELITRNFTWALQAIVALAMELFRQDSQNPEHSYYEWSWNQLASSSKSGYMYRARTIAGINNEVFLNYFRAEVNWDDMEEIYEGKLYTPETYVAESDKDE